MGWFKNLKDRTNLNRMRVETGTPQHIDGHWLCSNYLNKDRGVYYFYRGEYVSYRAGDQLNLAKTKYGYPVYRVLGVGRGWGSDRADFDDGRHYELEFVRFSDKPLIPTKDMMSR